jgi:hypothetical protein
MPIHTRGWTPDIWRMSVAGDSTRTCAIGMGKAAPIRGNELPIGTDRTPLLNGRVPPKAATQQVARPPDSHRGGGYKLCNISFAEPYRSRRPTLTGQVLTTRATLAKAPTAVQPTGVLNGSIFDEPVNVCGARALHCPLCRVRDARLSRRDQDLSERGRGYKGVSFSSCMG